MALTPRQPLVGDDLRSLSSYTFVDYATQGYSAVVGLLILFFHNPTVPHWPALVAGHGLSLLLVHALIRWNAKANPPHPAPPATSSSFPSLPSVKSRFRTGLDFLRHFYPVLLFTPFFCETGLLNRMFVPDYLDPVFVRLDQALFGCQPSVLFMEKLPFLLLSELFYASYFSYYLMIAGVGLALFLRNRAHFFHYVTVVSFLFYICYLVYIFLPVIGPMVFCHDVPGYALPPDLQQLASTDTYPDSIKSGVFYHLMAWIYRVFEAPGSAFPSSHVALALTTVYFSFRYLRPIRYLHLAVALLLCLATVYCRYHYVVDVLGGMLTFALLLPVANRLYFKSAARQMLEVSS